jgi:hypothetical protein
MKKIVLFWIIFSVFALTPQILYADQAMVQGQIIARSNNMPAPGLTVSLAHPNLGRSAPSMTDVYGRFIFYGIPIIQEPYFIEVYWGNQLIYRSSISVHNNMVNLPPLFL